MAIDPKKKKPKKKTKKPPGLTAKQARFAEVYVECNNASEAYRTVYDVKQPPTPETIYSAASRLLAKTHVSARVKQIREALEKEGMWTKKNSVDALKGVVDAFDSRGSEVTGAVKELNAMHGYQEAKELKLTSPDGSMTPLTINTVDPKEAAKIYEQIMKGKK